MDIELSFFIKKVISAGLMPIGISILLALISLWYICRENIKNSKIYLSICIAWIFLISYAPFANLMLSGLERNYQKLEVIPRNVEYILLLGGDRKKRAWEALRIYQKMPDIKIITSGLSINDKISIAEKTAKILEESGVKKENIFMQSNAKDTHEEAQYVKDKVGKTPFILITSAYHMPRSMKVFENEGLNPIAAPTDFNNPNESSVFSMLQGKQLDKTEKAMHEYIGLLWIEIRNII